MSFREVLVGAARLFGRIGHQPGDCEGGQDVDATYYQECDRESLRIGYDSGEYATKYEAAISISSIRTYCGCSSRWLSLITHGSNEGGVHCRGTHTQDSRDIYLGWKSIDYCGH